MKEFMVSWLKIAICLFFAGNIFAADKTLRPKDKYCGLYCMYSVFKLNEIDVNFYDFLKPQYISQPNGSSVADLQKLAKDFGLKSRLVGNLSVADLNNIKYPAILHVKYNVYSKHFEHYELFLGMDNGLAIIHNPPEPIRKVTMSELAIRWDGVCMLLSKEEISLKRLFLMSALRGFLFVTAVVSFLLVAFFLNRFLSHLEITKMKILAFQSIFIMASTLFFALGWHSFANIGFVRCKGAVDSIKRIHTSSFIPKVKFKAVEEVYKSNKDVFIDARLKRDYESGHIGNAINIPINLNFEKYQDMLKDIDKEESLIVYCQSSGCKYADKVASKLLLCGFKDVSIYKGGWMEWASKRDEE